MPSPEHTSVRLSFLEPAFAALNRIVTGVAAISLVCMALVEAWQVFARYVLNNSPSWTEPVALVLMTTTMMLGAAAGVRSDAHFGFFIGVEVAPPRLRTLLLVIARVTASVIGLLMAIWGGELLADNWSIQMAGTPLPQGLVYLPIAIGGALIAAFAVERLFSPPARSQAAAQAP